MLPPHGITPLEISRGKRRNFKNFGKLKKTWPKIKGMDLI